MILYHGTTKAALSSIKKNGLVNAHFTNSIEIATGYAEGSAIGFNTDPIILEVDVSEDQLRYDRAAMDEPVGITEDERDKKLGPIIEKNPEWIKGELLFVPEDDWFVSLNCVKSVKHRGTIPFHKIRVIEI